MIFHCSGTRFHWRHLCFSFPSLICVKDTGFVSIIVSLIVSVFFLAIRTISIFLCRLRSPWWAPDRLYIILSHRADTHRNPLSLRIDYCWPQYLFEGHLKTPNRPVKASKSAKSQKHAERERTLITEAFGNDFTNPRLGWKTRIPRTKHQFPSPAVNWMFSKMADGYSICCTQRIVLYETKAVSIYKL